jgi:hypothetical protein
MRFDNEHFQEITQIAHIRIFSLFFAFLKLLPILAVRRVTTFDHKTLVKYHKHITDRMSINIPYISSIYGRFFGSF